MNSTHGRPGTHGRGRRAPVRRLRWAAVLAAAITLTGLAATGPAPAAAAPACPTGKTSPGSGLAKEVHPVVLVHGWTGQPLADTQTALKKRPMPGWQFLLFDYHDASNQWADSAAVAGCLSTMINAVSAEHRRVGGDGKVYVVAHSMGGLAARYAARDATTAAALGGVVTIATPHTGSPWGNAFPYPQAVELFAGLGDNPLPVDSSAAHECLARHTAGRGLPAGCTAPPYLPTTVPVHQIAGVGTIQRTFFGIHAYDIPLGGDAVVPQTSAHGYIGSAAGGASAVKGQTVTLSTSQCSTTDSSLVTELLARGGVAGVIAGLTGALSQGLTDGAALDGVLAGDVNPAFVTLMYAASFKLTCGHSNIVTDPAALTAVADALASMAEKNTKPPLTLAYAGGFVEVPVATPVAEAIAYIERATGTTASKVDMGPYMCEISMDPGEAYSFGRQLFTLFTDDPTYIPAPPGSGPVPPPSTPVLVGWFYIEDDQYQDPLGLTTAGGEDGEIGIGTHVARVTETHPDGESSMAAVGTVYDVFYGDISNMSFQIDLDTAEVFGISSGHHCGD